MRDYGLARGIIYERRVRVRVGLGCLGSFGMGAVGNGRFRPEHIPHTPSSVSHPLLLCSESESEIAADTVIRHPPVSCGAEFGIGGMPADLPRPAQTQVRGAFVPNLYSWVVFSRPHPPFSRPTPPGCNPLSILMIDPSARKTSVA